MNHKLRNEVLSRVSTIANGMADAIVNGAMSRFDTLTPDELNDLDAGTIGSGHWYLAKLLCLSVVKDDVLWTQYGAESMKHKPAKVNRIYHKRK